jgi:Zn-dependent M16 (insulinase) family peptidase
VNYVGKGANLFELGYVFDGSALVILKYLRNTWLWERVRVQGGAYGIHCFFDHRSGVLTYVSYRDPNLLATLDQYDQAGRFLRDLSLDDTELTRAIIGAIGDLDAYLLPDAKGYAAMRRHLSGDTEDLRQRMRDEILTTTAADFKTLAQVLGQVAEDGSVVVLGSEPALETVNATRPGWLDLLRVL